MKIFSAHQMQHLDALTIDLEPIATIALMERASKAFCQWFTRNFPNRKQKVFVFCGSGNNGGDGLAIARLLSKELYEVDVTILYFSQKSSKDFLENLRNARWVIDGNHINEVAAGEKVRLDIPEGSIIIDAMLGSGLDKPLTGYLEKLVDKINALPATRVAVDIPTGVFADRPTEGSSIHADWTFSFETPKLAFFFPENQHRIGHWSFGSIGIHPASMQQEHTPFYLLDEKMVKQLFRPRQRHDHKGVFGHALLVNGSFGKMGAAVLAARACLRSGAGLVTVHVPQCGYQILQIAVPEAMVSVDEHQYAVTNIHEDLSKYKAIGIGCGIGTNDLTAQGLADLLRRTEAPAVLDADALNLLAGHPDFFKLVPKNSILTPHVREFERMFGPTANDFERNDLQLHKAQELGVYLILKGANTAIACPDGNCYFNNNGNPGMATGGSGDVLTGILTGLLAQGYSSLDACLIGVYLHGLAGDLAMNDQQQEALLASDITSHLGRAFKQLKPTA